MIKLYNGGAYLVNGTELVEQHPVSKEEAAKNILQKYMRSKEPTRENLSKGFRYLMSKGFDYDVAKQALSALGDLDDM